MEEQEDILLYDQARENNYGQRIPMDQAFRMKPNKQKIRLTYSVHYIKQALKELIKIKEFFTPI